MKHSNLMIITMIISSLFLIATCSVQAADITITDIVEDVSSIDYITQETNVVTQHPDIEVDNIDIVKATYSQTGLQATVTIQVRGSIENRGKIIDLYNEDEGSLGPLNFVEYDFQLSTTDQDYTISYANQTGQINNGVDSTNLTSSDFSIVGDTLSITFTLGSPDEVYLNMSATTMFVKMNISSTDLSGFVYLSDIAPNPTLEIMEAYAEKNIGSIGETIQFNGSIIPLTGQPPYEYRWNFGDGDSSTKMNPTHAYTKAGEYTFTFTVTDQAGDTVSETGTITISSEGGSNGSSNNQMILFLAIIAIMIVIGIVIIIWIIRR